VNGCAATRCDSMVERERLSWTNLRRCKSPVSVLLRSEDILILKSGYLRLIHQIQFPVVEQPKVGTDDCLNLSTDNYWLLIAATQLVVKLVQRSQVERSLSPIFQILSEMQENRWEHERSSKIGYVTIWEDWTDSWIREGPLLYIRSPTKRFRRKQICPHTEPCLVEDLNSAL